MGKIATWRITINLCCTHRVSEPPSSHSLSGSCSIPSCRPHSTRQCQLTPLHGVLTTAHLWVVSTVPRPQLKENSPFHSTASFVFLSQDFHFLLINWGDTFSLKERTPASNPYEDTDFSYDPQQDNHIWALCVCGHFSASSTFSLWQHHC